MLGWLLPQPDAQSITLQSTSSGAELVLTAQAQDRLGQAQAGLTIAGQLIAADNISSTVALREVAPGQYRAIVSGAPPGAYLVQLTARDRQGQPFGAVTAGAVVPQSAEYRSRGANLALLEGLAHGTSGRMSPNPAAAFDANGASQGAVREIGLPLLWLALVLLPFDVGLRRLLFGNKHVAAALRRLAREPRTREPKIKNQESTPARSAIAPSAPDNSPARVRTQNSDLERLREAQERARRRARGEE
jgi:hypothetical protein